MMEPIRQIQSRTAVLPYTNIDTDQIIPARFLRTTTRAGLGKHLFADWRYDADGAPKADFLLNDPAAADCAVLVAGRNFGCGSSREHAPWALIDYGFRAVISTEIADIFCNNSLKNGLLPVVVTVDLEKSRVVLPTGTTASFSIEGFARYCLLNGVDELGFLLSQQDSISAYERRAQA
jgi:3-isopropylmalate/(R)-2-methylmalate dehydratase small subunit